jgi:hypothetical protein
MLLRSEITQYARGKKFKNILSSLSFPVEIWRKTKTDSLNSTPHYKTFNSFYPSTVMTDQIMDTIRESDRTLLKPHDSYPESGNPMIWSVTIFTAIKETVFGTIDEDIKKTFVAFQQLFNLA